MRVRGQDFSACGMDLFRITLHCYAVTYNFNVVRGTACAGSAMAYKNLYGDSTSQSLIYSSTASNGLALDYSFQYAAKGFSTSGAIKGNFTAEYSVDGGANWTTLVAPVNLDSQTLLLFLVQQFPEPFRLELFLLGQILNSGLWQPIVLLAIFI